MSKILIISYGSDRIQSFIDQFKEHQLTVLSFSWDEDRSDVMINSFVREIKVPVEQQVLSKYKIYKRGVAKNNHDISFHLLAQYLKNFKRKAKDLAKDHDALILDHYALAPLLESIGSIPIIYNSYNAEFAIARKAYEDDSRTVATIREMEELALVISSGITYRSQEDFNFIQRHYKFSVKAFAHVTNNDNDYLNFVESIISKSYRPNSFDTQEVKNAVYQNRTKVLIYSIIRNRVDSMDQYYTQIKNTVLNNPEFEFYLSIYENDSNDGTKEKLFMKDWSFLSGVSIVTENLDTQYYGSVKDAQRVENLAKARNKGIEAGGFLEKVEYVLMVEGDVKYDNKSIKRLLRFKDTVPDFDVVSAVSLRKNGKHYDIWATRTSAVFKPKESELEAGWESKEFGKYYSTSNGLCLYRAKPFQEGLRHHWINSETREADCEMVVLCQNFINAGYDNIYVNYKAIAHHI